MRSSLVGWIGAALAVMAVAGVAGCYWAKYDKLTRTHVELLLAMADKLEGVIREEGAPPASFAEYRYPLERARDFARIVGPRFEGRPSLLAFRRLCDDYEEALSAAEHLRSGIDPATHARFEGALDALRKDAGTVRQALDLEARS